MLTDRKTPLSATTSSSPGLSKNACVGLCAVSVAVYLTAIHACLLYRNRERLPTSLLRRKPEPSFDPLPVDNLLGKTNADHELDEQCRFFLGESAIPKAGLGLYTAIDLKEGEASQPMPDICIYCVAPPHKSGFGSHSYPGSAFGAARFEGNNPRAACEGFATLWNNMPDGEKTSLLVSMRDKTNAGLHRATHPGAGAITQYYGATSVAVRDVAAGSEITVNYGDFPYTDDTVRERIGRSVDWLHKHAWCVDHIDIQQSTDPQMGRGAFARYNLLKGVIVAPAPVQVYLNRTQFHRDPVESVFVNYCLEIPDTPILLYPYSPGVNLINHGSTIEGKANVALRWSRSPSSHSDWMDLPLAEFQKMYYPGSLVLEFVATRDIAQGEELFLDYGPAWEKAWTKHVEAWKPVPHAKEYVYPAEMNRTLPFRTLAEQLEDPYPKHLATICHRRDRDRSHPPGTRLQWQQPKYDYPYYLSYCEILKRYKKSSGYTYTVAIAFDDEQRDAITAKTPESDLQIDFNVPHSAISFTERPYQSDMQLPNSFRHPITLQDQLVPRAWLA